MSKQTLQSILSLLQKNNIPFRHITHETIPRDSASASKLRGTTHEHGAKALILQTKSRKIIQAIVPAHQRISLKKLKKLLGEKNVSLAHPDDVLSLTTCVVGSVPPLGNLWNIEVYIDNTLLDIDEIVFSAGTLEDSIFISSKDLATITHAKLVNIISE